jgi:hypothetical protein
MILLGFESNKLERVPNKYRTNTEQGSIFNIQVQIYKAFMHILRFRRRLRSFAFACVRLRLFAFGCVSLRFEGEEGVNYPSLKIIYIFNII